MADQITSEIPEELDGERLDKALATIHGLSRARAREMILQGATIDGAEARPAERVSSGMIVVTGPPPADEPLVAEPVVFGVLFEDPDVIVVDKPAGLVVHPGPGAKTGTLAAGLLHRYPEIEGVGSPNRWGLVHRLDRDTSGVMLVARTPASFDELSSQLRRREVVRTYLALIDGMPGAPTGTIEAPIGRDPDRPLRRSVVQGGKHARTHFEIEESFGDLASLAKVTLETGRTHQIRVHFAAIDHPVVGDRTYGRKTQVESPRTFLHASSLQFSHPTDRKPVIVSSPLPDDLQEVLDELARAAE